MKLPVTEIKDLATAVAHTFNAADAIWADGKVDGKDLLRVGTVFGALRDYSAVAWDEVLPQAADIDEAEAADLSAHFVKELRLPNLPTVEQTLEAGYSIIVQAVPAVLALKAAFDQWRAVRVALPAPAVEA